MAQYKPQDHYYKKAKAAGHASRAIYKLEELQQRFRLIHEGDTVLDLGCAPGSWMQFAHKIVGAQGRIVGIDRLPVKTQLPPEITLLKADLTDEPLLGQVRDLCPKGVDCVLSDMAPNTSGVKFQDQCRSFELGELAWTWAQALLKPGGNLVIKLLYGEDVPKLLAQVKTGFQKAQLVHTQASRKGSTEIYIVAIGRK